MGNPQNYQIEFPLFPRAKKSSNNEGEEPGEYLVGAPGMPCEINLKDVFFLVFFDQEYPKIIIRSVNAPKRADKTEPPA
jgi:hypothetical protein